MKKDIVIIGSGPAGLSAGIYSARAGFDTLLIERSGMGGGQVLNTYEVDNYPGLPGKNVPLTAGRIIKNTIQCYITKGKV